MRVLVGEAVDLVLDGRAVARTHALDHAGEHRTAVEAGADDLVRAGIGVGDPAGQLLRMLRGAAHEAEHRHRVQVAGLFGALGEIDGAAVQARRGAGFQTTLRQLQFLEPAGQRHGRRVAGATGGIVVQADVDPAVEEGAGGQHDRPGAEAQARLGDRTDDAVPLDHQVVDGLLEQHQIGLVLQPAPDGGLVEDAIRLRAGGADRRALGAIENAELDAAFIGRRGHRAAQRVDLLHQMALADAADRRVATHLAQRLDVVGQQQRADAHAGRRQCGLGAGMAATDHDHVELFGIKHGKASSGIGDRSIEAIAARGRRESRRWTAGWRSDEGRARFYAGLWISHCLREMAGGPCWRPRRACGDNPAVMNCRPHCAACCIAPSISSPIPGMPDGKPAGVRCIQLDDELRCRIFGRPERPSVCGSLPPSEDMCGDSREQAMRWLGWMEEQTAPPA